MARCPICGRQFEAKLVDTMPFCSERCRSLDLGRWLDEEYGFPVEPEREEEPGEEEI